MCGICGLTKKDSDTLRILNQSLTHRGPDGSKEFCADGISLGHNRLAIIDLTEAASQPMQTADGRYTITFNGEIYNYKELREVLSPDYSFITESDTEVLLAAYVVWGNQMLKKLRGIFSFGIWDAEKETLLLCRDHMGVKPLYYCEYKGALLFSSELGSLEAIVHAPINTKRLGLYFGLNYTPPGETLLTGIMKLPAGHYLTYRKGTKEITEYFSVFLGDGQSSDSGDIYTTIDNAVKRQLVSERPVGIFLSGGIDSSVVLHHASKYLEDIKTFSVDFEMVTGAESETAKFNTDAEIAARTAKIYNAKHTTYTITIEDIRNNLERAIQSLDDPVANPTAISQYLLSKWVREDGVVVALGGDGGDELFGGYTRHRAMMASYYYDFVPSPVQSLLNFVHPRFRKLQKEPGLSLHVGLMANSASDIDRITHSSLQSDAIVQNELKGYYDNAPKDIHALNQFMRVDRRTWLAEESLLRSDRSSMAHGLELRVPLLDVDVVRLSDSISPFKKTTPWTGKKILREMYKNHLPTYLYNQPKRGWISPGAKWFRDPEIQKFCREIFSSSYHDGLDEIINWEEVQQMFSEHVNKECYYLQPLWNILVLQVWSQKYQTS